MAKFCTHCGSEVNENAVVCLHCGCAVPQNNGNRTLYHPQNSQSVSSNTIVNTIAQRYQINGIIWIVIAVIQLLLGISGVWTALVVGVLNLVSAVQDVNYSKNLPAAPIGIVDKVTPLTGTIITLAYNLVIGGVIGVAGSIYYLVAIRGYVLENREAFLEIERQYTNENLKGDQ